MLVLDTSVTIAWMIPQERTTSTDALLDRVIERGAVVPLLWSIEVGNALSVAVRRNRITAEQRRFALVQLVDLQISLDDHTLARAWNETLALADQFNLTLYDACYLELAKRRVLPLATLDRQLQTAARSLKIELLVN